MKQHSILFSGPMVCALLERRKTQTRRMSTTWLKVKAGDLLWVKETFCRKLVDGVRQYNGDGTGQLWFRASNPDVLAVDDDGFQRYRKDGHQASPWTSPLLMPRRYSRITLLATEDARLERLRDITEADAAAEGVQLTDDRTGCAEDANSNYGKAYRNLWNSLHGKFSPWEGNPEVARIAFEVWKVNDG